MKFCKPTILALAATTILAGCDTDATVASRNLKTAAEMFEIERTISFINGFNNVVMLEILGRCSVETETTARRLEVTCKVGDGVNGEGEFKNHYLGLSNNVTYIVEQNDPVPVGAYNYRMVLKPETVIPDVDVRTTFGSNGG